jgi:hypothetical protein
VISIVAVPTSDISGSPSQGLRRIGALSADTDADSYWSNPILDNFRSALGDERAVQILARLTDTATQAVKGGANISVDALVSTAIGRFDRSDMEGLKRGDSFALARAESDITEQIKTISSAQKLAANLYAAGASATDAEAGGHPRAGMGPGGLLMGGYGYGSRSGGGRDGGTGGSSEKYASALPAVNAGVKMHRRTGEKVHQWGGAKVHHLVRCAGGLPMAPRRAVLTK